ncbi:MAG: DUF1553 domain-containing protein [Pirellulales bacterium]
MNARGWTCCAAFLCLTASWAVPVLASDDPPNTQALEFFEKQVRPVLIERCYECHGPNSKKEGDLTVDSLAALLQGGGSGAAVVPGKPDESLLIDAVRYGEVFQMPPKSKLPADEIAALEKWVRLGAPWPGETATEFTTDGEAQEFTAEQKAFWAFQPVADPPLPSVRQTAWLQSPIDSFILAALEEQGLSPAAPADRPTLLRRATIDLLGLPPTPQELEAFLADDSPQAFERVVDRLLASPHYGERWGRHWLDVARYADSNGMDENLAFASAFRYRDYVVQAFNRDLPYDQFVREQIAGDLLPPTGGQQDLDRVVATGFLSLGAKMLAEDDPVKMEMDIIDEQVDTVGRAFLGLTLGCARCHDHKFDPIRAEDYYALAGIFKSTKTMENFSVVAVWNERPLATAENLAEIERIKGQIAARRAELEPITRAANESLQAAARRRAAEYLVMAGYLENLTDPRNSLMAGPAGGQVPGTMVIEAEDYTRGNAAKLADGYGEGIGVIINGGPLPNLAEYDLDLSSAGTYQLEIRYAAADSRPTQLLLNGEVLKADAAGQTTGSWFPDTQAWHIEGLFLLPAGKSILKLERAGPFPHFDKLALVPRRPLQGANEEGLATNEEPAALNPAFLAQWRKYVAATQDDPQALAYGWRLWQQTQADPEAAPVEPPAGSPASHILREPRPTSLVELQARYHEILDKANRVWLEQKANPATAALENLDDALLEIARQGLYDPQGPLAVPDKAERFYPEPIAADVATRREEIARLEASLPQPDLAMAVQDRQPTDLRVHIRGNHLTQGQQPVPRGFPQILAGESPPAINMSGSGRLQLADWLAEPKNPLTSRVMANRIWRGHFGRGIVASCDNFGRLGDRPSHPALLDWLAARFVEDGWSIKSLHKRIMLSSTYQMGGADNAAASNIDPENRLHWRHSRRRMEAEVVRDAILAVSGRLDLSAGGSLLMSKNREYVASTNSVNQANYDSQRRSVYLPVVRSALYEVFQAFDFADPSTMSGDRDSTTVAPQALFMMNSAVMLANTRQLAADFLGRAGLDDAARVRECYLRAYSRPPSEEELVRAVDFVARYESLLRDRIPDEAERRLRSWQGLCRAILSANEFIFVE